MNSRPGPRSSCGSWAIAATLSVILGAAYMLWLVQRLFYGPESELATSRPPRDLRFGQLAVLWPLAVLMLVMGLAPSLWLTSIQTGVHPPRLGEVRFDPSKMLTIAITPQGEAQR